MPDSDAPTPNWPDVTLSPETPVDLAVDRAVAAFEEAGYNVERLDGLLAQLPANPLEGRAGVIVPDLDPASSEPAKLVVVHPGQWDDDATLAVLNFVLATDAIQGETEVHLLGSEPASPVLGYLIGESPRSRFALRSLARIQEGSELTPETAQQHAGWSLGLMRDHLGVDPIGEGIPDSLRKLDEQVIAELSPATEAAEPDGEDGESEHYVPYSALIGVGCLAGEFMASGFRDLGAEAEWIASEQHNGAVALRVTKRESADEGQYLEINPIGEALKAYEQHEGAGLAGLFHTACSMLGLKAA